MTEHDRRTGPDNPTIGQLVQAYLRLALPNLAPRTQRSVRDTLQKFSTSFGNTLVSKLRAFEVIEWMRAHPTWKSAWTRKRVLAQVKRLLNWGWSVGLIENNPLRLLDEPAPEPGRAMTEAEFRTILRHADPPFKRAVLFLKWTGCRPAEMRALEWTHIDWARRVATLPFHKTRRKTRSPRILPLPPTALKLLAYLRRRTPMALRERLGSLLQRPEQAGELARLLPLPKGRDQNYVFLNACGSRWTRSALGVHFGRLRKRAGLGLDCRIYGLRHAYCTQAIRNGVNLKTVAELMGHASINMTEYYAHLAGDTDHLVAASEQANRTPQKGEQP